MLNYIVSFHNYLTDDNKLIYTVFLTILDSFHSF